MGCHRSCDFIFYHVSSNTSRLCNTIATVALIGTPIVDKGNSLSKSKQTRPQKLPRNQLANSRLVQVKGGFIEK